MYYLKEKIPCGLKNCFTEKIRCFEWDSHQRCNAILDLVPKLKLIRGRSRIFKDKQILCPVHMDESTSCHGVILYTVNINNNNAKVCPSGTLLIVGKEGQLRAKGVW